MKKLLILACMLWSVGANAQFTPGQVLTAAELNNQFALYAPIAGATFVGPVVAPSLTVTSTVSGAGFTTLLAPYATLASPTFTGTVTIPSGASIAGYAPLASPSFTGSASITSSATSGNTLSISATSNTSGAIISLTGNGGTTPTKSIRAFSGSLQVLNNAGSTAILGLTDAGSLSTLSSIVPSTTAGIVGTTLGDSANAGSVGEYLTATASSISLTTGTATNVTSLSLTAGDWDVSGVVYLIGAGGGTFTQAIGGSSSTSATLGALGTYWQFASTTTANATVGNAIPTVRYNVSSTTTVYAVALGNFASGTATAAAVIRARRVR